MTRYSKQKAIYAFFFVNLALILYFWWIGSNTLFSNTSGVLLALGKLSGLLAVVCVLAQFMMMGRARWVEEQFGLDKISRVHRLNGYLVFTFIIIHPILIIASYAMSAKIGFISQLGAFVFGSDDLLQAFLAVLLFIAVVGSSIYVVRNRVKYEWWYWVHLMTYLAIVLAWSHQLEDGSDFAVTPAFRTYWYALYIFVFGNVLLFRFVRPLYLMWRYRFKVVEVKREAAGINSVYISGRRMENFRIKPGQFMSFRFLSKGYWSEAHPFSLSWVTKNSTLRITPKESGDFTKKIPRLKKGSNVMIDGPFGIFTSDVAETGKYLFIAAGIGITPIRAMIEELAYQKKNIILLYTCKAMEEVAFKKELDELSKSYRFPIHYIMTQDDKFKGEKGRIDAEKIKRLVKDYKDRDAYICGPKPMIDATRATLKDLGLPASHIHFEKFSLP